MIDPQLLAAGFQAAASVLATPQAAPAVSSGTQNVAAGLNNYGFTVATSGSKASPTISGNNAGGATPAADATVADTFATAGTGLSGITLALIVGALVLLAGKRKKS